MTLGTVGPGATWPRVMAVHALLDGWHQDIRCVLAGLRFVAALAIEMLVTLMTKKRVLIPTLWNIAFGKRNRVGRFGIRRMAIEAARLGRFAILSKWMKKLLGKEFHLGFRPVAHFPSGTKNPVEKPIMKIQVVHDFHLWRIPDQLFETLSEFAKSGRSILAPGRMKGRPGLEVGNKGFELCIPWVFAWGASQSGRNRVA